MTRRSRWIAILLLGVLATRWQEADAPELPLEWATCEAPEAHPVPAAEEVDAPGAVSLVPLADLSFPTAAAPLEDGSVLVTLRNEGVVQVAPDGAVTEVLDLSQDLTVDGERGVLGIAVEPDGGAAFVAYTAGDGAFTLIRFALPVGDRPPEPETILTYPDTHRFHNGGQLAFGPDSMLYVGMGDGGDEYYFGDPEQDALSLESLFGKILRIDVTSVPGEYTVPPDNPFVGVDGARGEIWVYGLRNPWRFAFDRATDDLWVADVGHFCWEEINRLSADQAAANLGWNGYEAGYEFRPESVDGDAVVWPVHQYRHVPGPPGAEVTGPYGACAIVGGTVYRGEAVPELDGWYVYSDFCAKALFVLGPVDADPMQRAVLADTPAPVVSLAIDQEGELLVLTVEGLFRLEPDG